MTKTLQFVGNFIENRLQVAVGVLMKLLGFEFNLLAALGALERNAGFGERFLNGLVGHARSLRLDERIRHPARDNLVVIIALAARMYRARLAVGPLRLCQDGSTVERAAGPAGVALEG